MNQITDQAGQDFLWSGVDHKKYKYQVVCDYRVELSFKPEKTIKSKYFIFDSSGWLVIKAGYMWDGASGPTIDTISTIRASCVHDVGYQMIRLCLIEKRYKKQFDRELRIIMKQDYSPSWFGGSSCIPGSEK